MHHKNNRIRTLKSARPAETLEYWKTMLTPAGGIDMALVFQLMNGLCCQSFLQRRNFIIL